MTIIDILLKNRGLTTAAAIKEFFAPPHPQKISLEKVGIDRSQIEKAVKLIKTAIKNKRPIYVYGDYDADGICSTAVLWEALFGLKAAVLPYIAGRDDPVRGLSIQGLKTFKPHSLVITVDNGITGFAAADYAAKNEIELIITDHHVPAEALAKAGQPNLPPAAAIVHTDQLAGVGVAWFLARELGGDGLDLAAVGTIADMVPLFGPNRSLVKYGLTKLQDSPRPGVIALAKEALINLAEISPHQVSFSLAPRLNAMGRLADSLDALRLLCTADPRRAEALAAKLSQVNQLRQEQMTSMFADAREKASVNGQLICVQGKNYHEGLVGLVAGRLVEEFRRPALVVALGPQHAKASMRSLKGFNAIEAIRDLGDLVMERGGHPMAAGFTAEAKNLPKIKKRLEAAAAKLTAKDLQPETSSDCDLELKQIDWKLFKELEQFAPFGFGNPVPLFRAKKVKLLSFYPVGQENKHLKLKLPGFNAIAFGQGYLAEKLEPGQSADIIYSIEKNSWNNHRSLELKVKEIQASA